MKSIKQIREAYNIATNLSEAEDRKLSSLVELGLLDAKKLPALKESLNKPVEQMSSAEKRLFLNLLESVLSEMRVKQSKDIKDYYATPDPRVKRAGYPSQKEVPTVLLLKRKAIRVFPDGQKVALYYAQAIDKYVSIPYGDIGINEQQVNPSNREPEDEDDTSSSNTSSSDTKPERIFSNPKEAGRAKLNIGAPGDPRDVRIRTGLDSYIERLNRQAQAAMADVRENFQNNLEILNEKAPRPPKGYVPPKIRPKAGIGPAGKTVPEKTPWEKLTDIKDDGTFTGLGKDLMPVVGTVRQAKRTGQAYKKTVSDIEKGNYWDATKGAADVALQGGLTGLSGLGDIVTATGLGAAVVAPIKGAIASSKLAAPIKTAITATKAVKDSEKLVATGQATKVPSATMGTSRPPKTRADIVTGQRRTTSRVQATLGSRGARNIRGPEGSVGFETPKFRKPDTTTKSIKQADTQTGTSTAGTNIIPIRKSAGGETTAQLKSPSVQTKSDIGPTSSIELRGGGAKPKPVQPTPSEPRPSGPPTRRRVPIRRTEPTWRPVSPKKKPKPVSPERREPPTPISPERREPTTVPSEPRKIPDTSPTPAAQPRPLQQPENQPWKNADKSESPSGRKKSQDKKKEENKNRKGEDKPRKRVGTFIPGFSLSVDKGPLTPLNPKLSLNVLAPSGKPYTALDAADLIRQRKALAAQASMEESINLDGNVFELNNRTAEKVTALYESLNKKNKKKMIEMMSESAESLEKVISFAVRQ